nr:putative lipid II flippase FtsW [Bacilli bacterium]
MRRHKPDFILLIIILILVAFGLVMVYSASMVWAIQVGGSSPSYFFEHQLIAAVLGLILMIILMNVPYTVMIKYARVVSVITLGALFLVLIPGIGQKAQGVRRWLGPAFLHIQPSEISLVGILIYLAYIFHKNHKKIHSLKRGVLPPLIIISVQFLCVILEPDMGTAMLLAMSGITVMFAAGVRLRHLFLIFIVAIPVLILFIQKASYRSTRFLVFLHPWDPAYTNKGGYQLQQSLIAIFHGGLLGSGLGRGIEPFLYLPIPYADFIFSVIVEELGLLGATALLALFSILVWRGIQIGMRLENRFAILLAYGISAMIGYGVLINIGAVTGLLPVTGIPLPFISYGGTALVVKLGAIGLLLSLSRYTTIKTVTPSKEALTDPKIIRPFKDASGSIRNERRSAHGDRTTRHR